jgi:CRISPR-associated protein Cas1
MGWKSVNITKPCTIKVKNRNLLLVFEDLQTSLPIKDINALIFEDNKFTISAKALNLLSQNKVATLFCDEYFMPNSIMIPYHASSVFSEVAYAQINLTQDTKSSLWQIIIESKLLNQVEVLNFYDKDSSKVLHYAQNVKTNDRYNHEAKAARLYWSELFEGLKREQDSIDIRNQALNYAYAIVRSSLARDVSASGLLPVFGIWHNNRYNAFNLVDDLIEPFRPIVDIYVRNLLEENHFDFLEPQLKSKIINILNSEIVSLNNGVSKLNNAIYVYVKSFKKAIISGDLREFKLPCINMDYFNHECV